MFVVVSYDILYFYGISCNISSFIFLFYFILFIKLIRFFLFLSCVTLREGWRKEKKTAPFTSPMHLNLYLFFALIMRWNFSAGTLDFHRDSLICEWLSKTVFSRGSWTMARRAGASLPTTTRSTTETEVYMLITWPMGEGVTWCMVSDATAHTKALFLPWIGAKLFSLRGEVNDTNEKHLMKISHDPNIISL